LSRTSREKLRECVDPNPKLETTSAREEPGGEESRDGAPATGMESEAIGPVKAPEPPVIGQLSRETAGAANSSAVASVRTQELETTKSVEPEMPELVAPPVGETDRLASDSGLNAVTAREPEPSEVSNSLAQPPSPKVSAWVAADEGKASRATSSGEVQAGRVRQPKWPISPETGRSTPFPHLDVGAENSSGVASREEDSPEEAEALRGTVPPSRTAASSEGTDVLWRGSYLDPLSEGATRGEEDENASPKDREREEPEDAEGNVTTELVPLNKYRYAKRSQFILGAGLGILLCSVILIPVLRFSKQPARTILAEERLPRAVSVDSGGTMEQTSESIPGVTRQAPSAHGNSKNTQRAGGSAKSLTSRRSEAATEESSKSAGSASGSVGSTAAAQASANDAKNAVPTPNIFAFREPPPENRSGPLFEVPKVGNPEPGEVHAGDTLSGHSGGQAAPEIDLASSSVPFHTGTRVGLAPVGGDVQPAKLISSVLPDYPNQAKIQRISGDVIIDVTIDGTGKVTKMQVVSGPMILREAALRAVGQWKYQPALLDGKPTPTHATVTVKFLAK